MEILKQVRNKKLGWLVAAFLVIIIKIFSLNKEWVERYYTYGIYPPVSEFQNLLFGWLPFSIGDILYVLAAMWLIFIISKNIILVIKRGFKATRFFPKSGKAILILIYVYIGFNLLWGLNYNRLGVAHQLNFSRVVYDTADLLALQELLIEKVNHHKKILMSSNQPFPSRKELFKRSGETFATASQIYPFLDFHYSVESVKSSMFGWLGNYLGFTGYYNPFTGEAQANTTVPEFLQPGIINHEIAHQLGYAKEDEASFVGYLAILHSQDPLFKYSAYLDLFAYANSEVYYFDSVRAGNAYHQLIPAVKKDMEEWREFSQAHRTILNPVINWLYSKYLKMNEQPQGMRSYNRVIVMVMAYYKKMGEL